MLWISHENSSIEQKGENQKMASGKRIFLAA